MEEINYDNGQRTIDFNWWKVFDGKHEFISLLKVKIPAALGKNKLLGHILLYSDDSLIIDNFISVLQFACQMENAIKTFRIDKNFTSSDLAVVLTNLDPGDIVSFITVEKVDKKLMEMLEIAIKDFVIKVEVGKGNEKRTVIINVPPFTALFVVGNNDKLPINFLKAIDTIIEPTFKKDELVKIEICNFADKFNLLLTNETLNFLVNYLKDKHVKSTIRFLSDYVYLNPNTPQPLEVSSLEEILKKYNM